MHAENKYFSFVAGRLTASLFWIPLLAVGASAYAIAQSPSAEVTPSSAAAVAPLVPQQVRYAGKLATRAGDTVEAVFRIYARTEGGEPLWTETQKIAVGEDGSYTVLLGAATTSGLPQTVFAGGVARWLGVSVERGQELDRAMLASVPYAMKSADAEALAGHAATDFVTQAQLAQLAAQTSVAVPAEQPEGGGSTVTGTGTANTVPLWTGAATQGNSDIVQVGTDVGINEATPTATLDVGGTANIRGQFNLPSVATATTTSGSPSELLQMSGSAWSTTTNAAIAQNFKFAVEPLNNNTASPSSYLLLQYQSGTGAASNLLSIANTGIITFAPSQTFPGTITGVLGTSPIIAGISGHNIAVQLSMTALESTLNAYYGVLSGNNTFNGNQTIRGSLDVEESLSGENSILAGYSSSAGGYQSTGPITVEPRALATTSGAVASPIVELGASAYNSTAAAAVAQNFAWQAQVTGNNTASPVPSLQLQFGSGTTAPAATGLSVASNGQITFAPGQIFPVTGTGGGTITGITTTSPLTGSGTSGSVALGLNTAALETTLNSVYPQLATGDTFSSYLVAQDSTGAGTSAVQGLGTNGSVGTSGVSDTGYGVQGKSTSGQGVYASVTTPQAGSAGVLGFTGTAFSSTYGIEAGIANAGVWADTSAAGTGEPVALFSTADNAFGAAIVTAGADYPSLLVSNSTGEAAEFSASTGYGLSASTNSGTGLYGTTEGSGDGVEGLNSSTTEQQAGVVGIANTTSVIGSEYNIYSGVWGDTGISSTNVAPAWAIGVLGTADDSFAGVYLNDSANFSTLFVKNYNTNGTTGLFTTLMASGADGTCGIGSGGSLSCTGQIKSLVSSGSGARTVETYAVQSPENWMEDFGSGMLENGVAVVKIDAAFAETVTGDASYHVFITPNGDSKGLYVIAKTPTTFEVRESGGGTSSLSFDYRIVAKRRGYEAQRLVDVTDRFNTERKMAMLNRGAGVVKHKPMTRTKSPLIAALDAHPGVRRAAQIERSGPRAPNSTEVPNHP